MDRTAAHTPYWSDVKLYVSFEERYIGDTILIYEVLPETTDERSVDEYVHFVPPGTCETTFSIAEVPANRVDAMMEGEYAGYSVTVGAPLNATQEAMAGDVRRLYEESRDGQFGKLRVGNIYEVFYTGKGHRDTKHELVEIVPDVPEDAGSPDVLDETTTKQLTMLDMKQLCRHLV